MGYSAIGAGRSKIAPVRQFRCKEGRVAAFVEVERGPAVLLIHGNSSSKEIFVHQIGVLRRLGFGVVVPDLPGHGASENARRPTLTYSLPGYACVLRALLDQLQLSEVHVVGWSLGGHVALELLHGDPRVRSVLVTGAPPVDPKPEEINRAFLWIPAAALAGQRALSSRETRAYAECLVGGKAHVTSGVLAALRRTDGRARHWWVKNALRGIGANEAEIVRSTDRPLAIVHGRRDAFVNPEYLLSLPQRSLWRGGVQLMEAGHAPHWERPRLFNRLMSDFLTEVTAR